MTNWNQKKMLVAIGGGALALCLAAVGGVYYTQGLIEEIDGQVTQKTEAVAAAGRACEDARVAVFASSHSCLPVLQGLGGGRWLANNGAAGMPNVAGQDFGLLTRLSRQPARDALVQVRSGALHLALCPIRFDPEAWWRRFESLWPPGSAAHDSYATRIRAGVAYPRGQILRPAPPGAT